LTGNEKAKNTLKKSVLNNQWNRYIQKNTSSKPIRVHYHADGTGNHINHKAFSPVVIPNDQ